MSQNTHTRSLSFPNRVFLRNVGGKPISLDVSALPDAIVERVFEVGAKTILTNVYNGGGKDASDAEKLAALQKKMDAWARGEFAVVERGESQFTAMREAWLDEFRAATGASIKQADEYLSAKVKDALGKDAKATFSHFLDVTANEYVAAKQFDNAADAREALEAHYAKLADDAAKQRDEAAKKLKAIPALDLSAFKKAK
jgi:hypothetical protein